MYLLVRLRKYGEADSSIARLEICRCLKVFWRAMKSKRVSFPTDIRSFVECM